jgi:hypothetical protein
MRNEPIVNFPAALCDNVDFGSVIIRSGSCGDIVRAYKALGDRIVGVELERLSDDVSLLSALPQGLSLTLKLRPAEAANVYTSSWLSDRFALAALIDVEKGLLEGVKIVTSAQIPVVINLDSLSDDSELISVLDYYLHDRHLQVPIEFLHSLFTAQIQGQAVSLADVYSENPEQHLYVDESGAITCSPRLAKAGKFFGSINADPQIDRESAIYKTLINLKKSLFLSGSSCVSCEAFDVCAGYLRIVDTSFDCAPWLRLFKEIKATAKEIVEDLADSLQRRS